MVLFDARHNLFTPCASKHGVAQSCLSDDPLVCGDPHLEGLVFASYGEHPRAP